MQVYFPCVHNTEKAAKDGRRNGRVECLLKYESENAELSHEEGELTSQEVK